MGGYVSIQAGSSQRRLRCHISICSMAQYTVCADLMQVEPIMIYGRNYNCIFFCRPDAGSSHCSFAVWKTDEDDDRC